MCCVEAPLRKMCSPSLSRSPFMFLTNTNADVTLHDKEKTQESLRNILQFDFYQKNSEIAFKINKIKEKLIL